MSAFSIIAVFRKNKINNDDNIEIKEDKLIVSSKEGTRALDLENGLFKVALSAEASKSIAKYGKKDGLILGVRPESVKIHAEKGTGRFQAEILFLEHFGSMNIVNLQIGEKILKARTKPTYRANPKDKVWLEFEGDRIIIFDEETEKAIPRS